MAMVVVDGGSLTADSQPKSVGLVCVLAATWCSLRPLDEPDMCFCKSFCYAMMR